MKKELILIKLGGSAITDKNIPYKTRPEVIERLAKELKPFIKNYKFVISHGAGSFAHTSAVKYGGKKGYKSLLGISTVSRDASKLNQIVVDILVENKIPAISMRPMSMILASNGKLLDNFFEPISEMLNQDLIPVVYGDVIWDKKWKSTIFSGEKVISELVNYISKDYKVKKIIQVGNTDGVYDLENKTIKVIDKSNLSELENIFTENKKIDVTGGMKHKVATSIELSKKGITTAIVNGLKVNELKKVLSNKEFKGTIINL